jgi:hypothetical protein
MIAWRRIPMAGALAALASSWSAGAAADAISDAFKQIAGDTFISRDVTLSELGFTQPMVMNGSDAAREIYLPVPAGLPLSDAFLQLDGNYLRTDGGRTTILLSVDGHPVAARSPTDEAGVLKIGLGIDGTPRPNGLVRVGVTWSSYHARQTCDEKSIGNSYEISDQSRLTFRYDGSSVRDLATAWTALPAAPVLLVANRVLSEESYDAAWRIGLALRQAGKSPVIQSLPAVGETVDLRGITVPGGLASLPVFAGLGIGGTYTLRSPAEVGALLLLRSAAIRPDVMVTDDALISQLNAALDALGEQLRTTAPTAQDAFTGWRNRNFHPPAKLDADAVQLVTVANRPVIAVAPPAAAKAAVLFDVLWRQTPIVPAVLVRSADRPQIDTATVSLSRLGGSAANFEVLERSDWTAAFDLGVLGPGGRLPVELVIDVAVAPSPSTTPPVVSIFLNNYLLGARRVDIANGQRLRISAPIPRYALDSRNMLRVSVQRQPVRDGCREDPKAYPASILPSSHIRLEAGQPSSDDFMGVLPRMADKAQIIVPRAYLNDAPSSLPRVIELAVASAVLPDRAKLTVSANGTVKPDGTFLALDAAIEDIKQKVTVEGGRLKLVDSDRTLFDVSGLDRIGVIELASAAGQVGITYRTVGRDAPDFKVPFRLSRGDIVVVGSTGLLAEIDSRDPSRSRPAYDPGDRSPWYELSRLQTTWLIGTAALLIFVYVIGRVLRARARRRIKSH